MARIGRRDINISRAHNSNQLAVQRAHAAQRTAQSIAADRRNARNAALQNVHREIDQLTALPPGDNEYVVERLVPARFQPVAQSQGWLSRITREARSGIQPDHETRTVFEYSYGRPEFAHNPQRVRVAELLRGWLLPDIIQKPDVSSRIITSPDQDEPGALVVVSDHRSWAGGVRPHYTGPADVEPPKIIGVVDNNFARWGSQAIEGRSAVSPQASEQFVQARVGELDEIAAALEALRH